MTPVLRIVWPEAFCVLVHTRRRRAGSRSRATYGGPSMSRLSMGVYHRLQISARRTCTVSSTTMSPEYVLPLLTRIHGPPSFTPAPVGCVLRLFSAVTPADVVASVKALPASSVRPIRCQHGCSRNMSASFHRSCVSCSTGRLSTARSRRVSNAPTLRRC